MSLIEKLRVWANAGTKEVIPDAKVDAGWGNGEQPPFEYENERRSVQDTKINELVDFANRDVSLLGPLFDNISDGNINAAGFPFSTENSIYGSGQILDSCFANNVAGRFIYWLQLDTATTGSVHYKNMDTGTTDSFVIGPTEVGLTIASDGNSVYILSRGDYSATEYGYRVIAYDVGTSNAKTGFTSFLLGIILKTDAKDRPILRVLKSGTLVAGGRWHITGSNPTLLTMNQNTGAVIDTSTVAGDGISNWPTGDVVTVFSSDFFITSTDAFGIISVYLFSESGLTPDDTWPLVLPLGVTPGDAAPLASLGRYLALAHNPASISQPILYIYDTQQRKMIGDLTFDYGNGSKIGSMFFDGHNLWAVVYLASTTKNHMIRINIASLNVAINATNNLLLSDILNSDDIYQMDNSIGLPDIKAGRPTLTFDGQSIWAAMYEDTPSYRSESLHRVFNSFIR